MKSRRLVGHKERYWVVDGERPSERDFERLRRRPYLHVFNLPGDVASLDFLEPVIETIERLIVTDRSSTDSRVLRHARRLTELDLWTDEHHLIDFAELTHLRAVALEWQPQLSTALEQPGLRRVMIDRPPADLAQRLGSQVEDIRLSRARLIPPSFSAPPDLTTFEISGTSRFDAMSLAAADHLRSLTVADVARLAGLVSLSRRVALETVVLEDIEDLDDLGELHLLRAGSLLGVGKLFRDLEVAAALRRAPIDKIRLPPGT